MQYGNFKNYALYSSDQRKIDNQRKRILGYEKMKRDLTTANKKLNKQVYHYKKFKKALIVWLMEQDGTSSHSTYEEVLNKITELENEYLK